MNLTRFFSLFLIFLWKAQAAQASEPVAQLRARVLAEAGELFNEYQVSYAYGGNRVGTDAECEQCNACLDKERPAPKQRFKSCPSCYHCSLDCSHFTQLIFKNAGLYAPYLTTKTMLALNDRQLMKRYKLIDLGREAEQAQPGDLLVYRGHVVMLTATRGKGRGDIIHATGGKDIREPGQGIQRERYVPLDGFRGPLLRVLRHAELVGASPARRMRPVRKK